MNLKKDKKVIFVTVGTTRFDNLVKHVLNDQFIKKARSLGIVKLVLQAGSSIRLLEIPHCISKFNAANIDLNIYDYKPSLDQDIQAATFVIGHAGAGTCLDVLRQRKPLLVVTNTDLMDNHQLELADKLHEKGYLIQCSLEKFDVELTLFLRCLKENQLRPFPRQDTRKFGDFFAQILAGAES